MIHPTHITLCNPDHPFERIAQIGNDPWIRSLTDFRSHGHHSRDVSGDLFAGPAFDVRVTNEAYFVDGEFPGVKSKEDIILEMAESRTLCISAQVARIDLAAEWGDLITVNKNESNKNESPPPDHSGDETQMKPAEQASFEKTRAWVHERHVGYLQRSFTFPPDAEFDSLTARLSDGVLKIMIRRGSHKSEKRRFYLID